jgi:anaerobic selenocysteine-containing dehydrogenase
MDGDTVTRIRGDRLDVFSRGYVCPKGTTLGALDSDPDRIRTPMIRTGDTWRAVSWSEAFAEIDSRLRDIHERHGRDAVALYIGNPTAHNLSTMIYNGAFVKAFKTKNFFSASTVDQMPKQVSAAMMFGTVSVPVPDVDRTSYLLMLGADPWESNGSLLTAADLPGRLEKLRDRGGRFVVVDPRRSATAKHADEHIAIRPGTDSLFLLAIVNVLFEEGLVRLGAVDGLVNGVEDMAAAVTGITPEAVVDATGVTADVTRRIARELAAAPTAAVYGRIGTCVNEFGTLTSWLIDVVNVLTGNLDTPGGAMFTTPVAGGPTTRGKPRTGRGARFGRWASRVSAKPEIFGELPVTVMPEEIETPGDGQVRALFTIAGNPVMSNPDSDRLDRALSSLELMVSVDIYLNETSRHAHVLLPAPRSLTRSHYDVLLYRFAVRNVANWSPALVELDGDEMAEWEILLRLAAIAEGLGPNVDVAAMDDAMLRSLVTSAVGDEHSLVFGRDVDELMTMLSASTSSGPGPDRHLDFQLRTGPFGDGFGIRADGLSLSVLAKHPHGLDLGPLEPRLPEGLRTPSGQVELCPTELLADIDRLNKHMKQLADGPSVGGELMLIGRRQLRSNNSWMHNINVLVKGRERCTLLMHPDDVADRDLRDGDLVTVTSSSASVSVPLEVSDDMVRGVVSLPHGWGHDMKGTQLGVASQRPGANTNRLIGGDRIDPLSGNATLNGVAVSVQRHFETTSA